MYEVPKVFVPKNSSHVVSAEHDGQHMVVTYRDGGSYKYFNVPQGVFEGLKAADSAGSYLARHVKARFHYQKVPEA